MITSYRIELEDVDLEQILDDLKLRAESWERTAHYLRTGETPEDEFFVVEECSKPEEADRRAEGYHAIILNIQNQIDAQEGQRSCSLSGY